MAGFLQILTLSQIFVILSLLFSSGSIIRQIEKIKKNGLNTVQVLIYVAFLFSIMNLYLSCEFVLYKRSNTVLIENDILFFYINFLFLLFFLLCSYFVFCRVRLSIDDLYMVYFFINFTIWIINCRNFFEFIICFETLSFIYFFFILKKNAFKGLLVYMFLGLISSILLIFGFIIVYTRTGFYNFFSLRLILANTFECWSFKEALVLKIGFFFVMVSFFYKLAIPPFYLWLKSTFESINDYYLAILSVFSKPFFFMLLLSKFSFIDFDFLLKAIGVLTTILGFGAIFTQSIRVLIAYSGVYNIGLCLIIYTTFDSILNFYSILFILIYSLSVLQLLSILLHFKEEDVINIKNVLFVKKLSHLKILVRTTGFMKIFICFTIFSLIGLPPFTIFVIKISIILFSISVSNWLCSSVLVTTGLLTCVYYLRLIQYLFVDRQYANQKKYIKNFFFSKYMYFLNFILFSLQFSFILFLFTEG